MSVSDDKIQITILILRRGALSIDEALMLYERYEGMAHNWPDCRQVNLVLRVTHSQRRSVWGPPLVMLHFWAKRGQFYPPPPPPPPIGDVTLSGTDYHGFCLVPMGFEIVSWSLMVSGWFPCFLKVV